MGSPQKCTLFLFLFKTFQLHWNSGLLLNSLNWFIIERDDLDIDKVQTLTCKKNPGVISIQTKNDENLGTSESKPSFAEVASNPNITIAPYILKKRFFFFSWSMMMVRTRASSLQAYKINSAKSRLSGGPLAPTASVWKWHESVLVQFHCSNEVIWPHLTLKETWKVERWK